jgi:hypothetical protein
MEMGSACRHGSAQPITALEALSTLRAHGFTVYREEVSLFCGGENSAQDVIATVLQTGPHENFSDPGEIGAREGTLYCGLHARPVPQRRAPRRHRRAGSIADLLRPQGGIRLGNLECTLYPEGEETDAQIARLRDAFIALERNL